MINKKLVSVPILLMILWFLGRPRAEGQGSAPLFHSGQEAQVQSQTPAREFTPCVLEASKQGKDIFSINRFFQTEFTIQNTGPSYKNHTILWCSLPLCNGCNQIVPKVFASHKAQIYKDTYGNHFLRFDIKDIHPYATQVVRVDSEVLKSKQPETSDDSADELKQYLMEDELLEVNHPKIQELAKKLQEGESAKTARKIFGWVRENVTYTGYDLQDKGALHGLIYSEGDCTEQAALFTALWRAPV